MSSKRGGRGQPQGKQYGPKKTPPAQEPPVVLVQVLLPKGEKSGEFERKMRRRDPDFDKKVEIINSIFNDYGVRVDMKSFMKNPEKFSLDGVLKPYQNSLEFIKKEMPEFFTNNKDENKVVLALAYNEKISPNTYAQAGPYSGITFGNLFTSKDVAEHYEKDVKSGFHPQGTSSQDILTHELGHSIHNLLINMDFKAKNPNSGAFDEYLNHVKEHKIHSTTNKIVKRAIQEMGIKGATYSNLGNYTKEISNYAKTNSAEAIAEAVSDVRANGTKAKALSRSIVNVIKGSLIAGGVDAYIASNKKSKGKK